MLLIFHIKPKLVDFKVIWSSSHLIVEDNSGNIYYKELYMPFLRFKQKM